MCSAYKCGEFKSNSTQQGASEADEEREWRDRSGCGSTTFNECTSVLAAGALLFDRQPVNMELTV